VTFFERLRQRKVVQWSVAYAAGAWGVLQGLSYSIATFGWSPTLQPLATVLFLVGLPIVVVLAWYHGDRGVQRATGTELAIIALLFVLGGAVFWNYQRTAVLTQSAADSRGGRANGAAPVDHAPPNSIAVLPFVNMSDDPENQYFSDGISEEILNVLARSPGLQVAARTSSFAYRDTTTEVPDIARELRVRMILEGSVRKQGEQVRVTAQLVDATTGYHVWSETYDRRLEDIFAIQDDIARSIGAQMRVRMPGAVAARTVNLVNQQAHDHYLRGLAYWQTRRDEDLWRAVDEFEKAVAIEPGYAAAYGGLALVYSIIPDYSIRIAPDEAMARAGDAAERALALDPSAPEPYASLGIVAAMQYRRETSEALLRRAIEIAPSYATAHQWLGTALASRGDPEGGVRSLATAFMLDPRSLVIAENYAAVLMSLARYEDAIAACRTALQREPDNVNCLHDVGISELMRGNAEAARPAMLAAARPKGADAVRQAEELVDAFAGRADRAVAARRLASFPLTSYLEPGSGNAIDPVYVPLLLMGLDAPQEALDYIDRNARLGGYIAFLDLMLAAKALDPVRCDPRLSAAEQRLKMSVVQRATLCGDPP
jgi:TolB-like protein/Tfp pilus assembly protein PilF